MPPRTSSRSRCICRFRRSRRALRARSKWVKKRTAVAVRFFLGVFCCRCGAHNSSFPRTREPSAAARRRGESRHPSTSSFRRRPESTRVSSFRRRPESTRVSSFRRRPESTHPSVIPAKAGIHFDFAFSSVRSSALSRKPTHVLCGSSAIHGGRSLSLARARESNQREHALGSAPSPLARVRCGRTGFAHRPSMACCRNRRDPSRRPRAVHAAFPFALRRGSEGTQEPALTLALSRKRERGRVVRVMRLEPLLRQGLPRFRSSRAPLGRGEKA